LKLKLKIFLTLFAFFFIYTLFVYTKGAQGPPITMNEKAIKGKMLFQKKNCPACHQLYGLGGYLGPELTTVVSQSGKEAYSRTILKTGTQRMPDFHFNEDEIDELIEFLKYVDATAITYREKNNL
jgi:nitric oxide reductase subunit C